MDKAREVPPGSMIDAIQKAINDKSDFGPGESLAERIWRKLAECAAVKPIGWISSEDLERLETSVDAGISVSTERSPAASTAQGKRTVPLYTVPQSPPLSGNVTKKLVWHADGKSDDPTYLAMSILGRYAVWMRKGKAYIVGPGYRFPTEIGLSVEEGMKAAQDDFNLTILSALRPECYSAEAAARETAREVARAAMNETGEARRTDAPLAASSFKFAAREALA